MHCFECCFTILGLFPWKSRSQSLMLPLNKKTKWREKIHGDDEIAICQENFRSASQGGLDEAKKKSSLNGHSVEFQ